ncbi:ABC transporter substrate-binding protein [Methylovirgula sp. HY1]|uniref:ABC transporter substrate-binding protein n=1 Tax=Methylovirgula sp. HY1 TaxID=2822761 RepID=UPI001C5B7A06|nr:ABC transporter substrate-binding protein [Methylovirgula sp. HY1]
MPRFSILGLPLARFALSLFLVATAVIGLSLPAAAVDRVTFATNWRAEAEHGGFYQAVADGTYAKYGLDVAILQGGPQSNNRLLLAAGRIDFDMGGNMIQAFDAVAQNVPIVAVAAIFQKDPFILMSHPGVGLDDFKDLRKATTYYVGSDALVSVFQWLHRAYGFSADRVTPYTFNSAPFIADKTSIQEGYVTSEPFAIEKQGGFKPNVFLAADHGYQSYSTTIEARRDLIAKNPDLVQRFVTASIIGWYHYLYGDNAAANALIEKDNPDMTDAQIAYSVAAMKVHGIVDSGDAEKLGIGAMTDQRMRAFFDQMVEAGLFKKGLDYRRAYVTKFVDHGVGLDLRPKR